MQIPILNGIYTDGVSDFRTSYPRNLMPVPKQQGISQGYLRPAEGIVQFGSGPGTDRGGINWNGVCYRVMGTKLVSIDQFGAYSVIGDVGVGGQATFDYSFDRLAVSSGGRLYYWDGSNLKQVTDVDLRVVVDFLWVDGYFMTTDGQHLVVTELNDPMSVNPIKYGSSEADPDPIVGLIKLRNEVYALNRYTIEVFQNVGGDYFPFERIEGAQMQRGAIGTATAAMFMENIAFLGGGRNEAPAVWLGSNSSTAKISTREIDQILGEYTEAELALAAMEVRVSIGHQLLYLHLKDQTLVYDGAASQIVQEPVWFVLTSSLVGLGQYRARNFVWCYNKWLCGDPTTTKHGYLVDHISSHYGDINGWDFGTVIIYNEGRGAIFNELELVCLTGNVALGVNPTIWTSYTVDGQTWSQERPRTAGKQGERLKRIAWLQQGFMRHWRCQRFRGTSDSHISIARLEAQIEGMNV
jgi:Phage stabilisation protein